VKKVFDTKCRMTSSSDELSTTESIHYTYNTYNLIIFNICI
jgi:hypothetical protein